MSAILCLAAMHLAILYPQNTKYSHASMQLMAKTVQLFRKNLARSLTKDHCEALMVGARSADSVPGLDLAQDQLFLLSPGIIQVWFQAMPIFIDEGSVFTQIIHQNPRFHIENALLRTGEDPARFVEPFMSIWDDLRHQSRGGTTVETDVGGPTFYAWHLLFGLEVKLSCRSSISCAETSASMSGVDERKNLEHIKEIVTEVTTACSLTDVSDAPVDPSPQSARSSFENIIRRMSPLLYCASLKSTSNAAIHSSIMSLEANIEQLFYGFPILCCGPFAKLMVDGDSRALIFLCHFYRAARTLLTPERCWWACVRSRAMEELILEELKYREVDVSLNI
ncbi:c6 transcription factor [Trichoderma arundinaceum]|uniref:C6 transcription factor n=1 Tax=Trichoderma arundinaceum TaxID=490622 RepID=A0A395NKP3_TRIAR|nr:c6 transcription factor [Trichoderma arundinaceum]